MVDDSNNQESHGNQGIKCVSQTTGAVIWRSPDLRYPVNYVSIIGDVNTDSYPDIFVKVASTDTLLPEIFVISGANGSILVDSFFPAFFPPAFDAQPLEMI